MEFLKKQLLKIFDLKILIIIGLLILGYFIVNYQLNKIDNLNNKYQTELKLRNALNSDIDSLIDENGDLKQSKKTLQTNINRLNDLNNELSENQKQLLKELKQSNKKREVLAAANMIMSFKIDSLDNIISKGFVDTTNKKIVFKQSTSNLKYHFTVSNVIPFNKNKNVTHKINNIDIPNTQYIEFTYEKDGKKNLYPVSFSVKNTNKYMEVHNIDSYIIPEINPDDLEVGFFERTWLWYQKQSTLAKLGIGFILGGGTIYTITK